MQLPEIDSTLDTIRKKVDDYHFKARILEEGIVTSVGDGIAWIKGLPSAAIDEIIITDDGSRAMVFHLTDSLVGAILLEQTEKLSSGSIVSHLSPSLSIPIGDNLLGRVITPLGVPLDNGEPPQCEERGLLDIFSPPIIKRDFINQSLYTGNKILDNLIPIGKGQRELLIGDNGLGKSSLALDIIVNQKNKNVQCVYVLIGQNRSNVLNIIHTLKESEALAFTTVVVAEASALPGLQYLAPYAGCTIAEYWMNAGLDTLVVYDDLTSHANSYRELSLLLRRPPGREAFPADIFYLHAKLLERATCLLPEIGGGSMTALPIIETKEGEIATYLPTNLISITDGQIYFDAKLFSGGFYPAIDITKSVSRIGGQAQHASIKKEAGRMKLDYMQFLDLEIFTRFGSKLDDDMKKRIRQGQILREIFKQDRLSPLSIEFQLAWLISYNDHLFYDYKLEDIPMYLKKIDKRIENSHLDLTSPREEWVSFVKSCLNS